MTARAVAPAPALIPDWATATAAWAARVRGNREQVDRLRETPDGADFYGPIAQAFRADPLRTDEPALETLRSLVLPGETWLDIGAGGGRYALPLARRAGEVIALDPSPGMLDVLRAGMAEHRIENIRVIEARWPAPNPPEADVALIAHVGYDVEEIGPFVEAMEASARRLCVAVLLEDSPAARFAPFFQAAHGEARILLPALGDFLALLLARGRLFEVSLSERGAMRFPAVEDALGMIRRQTWTQPGSEKDHRAEAAARAALAQSDGGFNFDGRPSRVGVVSWEPR
jgi:SAM-dependent methyltransferase